MKIYLLTTICIIANSMMVAAQVPSLINYQGRLTDAIGDPVSGSKNFATSIYDAATGGNLLYNETIGSVVLDANGVYSFQFGSAGISNTQITETVATTDGTGAIFQKVLDNSAVVAGSVSVTDGTYTWNQSDGSSNEDDFGVAYSTSLRRVTVIYYNSAPVSGKTITVTYRDGTGGITEALSAANTHWLELSIDGVAQSPRERVLSVPFAQIAGSASNATGNLANEISALKHPGFIKVTEVGTYKTGEPGVVVGAGYRMEVLTQGIQATDPNDPSFPLGAYVMEYIKLSGLSKLTDYRDSLYIDGPAVVSMSNDSQQVWFSYQIGLRAGNGQVGTYKVGEPAVVVEAGYRMKVLAQGGSSGYDHLLYVDGLGVKDADSDYGVYIDGPAEVSMLNAEGFFTYEINEFVVAD